MRINRFWQVAILSGVLLSGAGSAVRATEGAASFYLLGQRGPMAGFLPPPGLYFQNDVYYYSGSASASRRLPLHGNIVGDVKVRLWADAPSLVWSTPVEILGGNLALVAVAPIGGPRVNAGVTVNSPVFGTISRSRSDSIFTVGDPLLGATIGWHSGNWHSTLGVLVNTPIGDYHKGELANLAFHHWGEDVTWAVTWFDPKVGLDVSGAIGFTFNQENFATRYRSGTEMHIEAAVTRHFSNGIALGLLGYYYHQLTGDSGAGARLGPFKGRVAAVGGYAGYTFHVDQRPITASIKIFKEFEARNRLDNGVAGYFTIAVPLVVNQTTPARPISARY